MQNSLQMIYLDKFFSLLSIANLESLTVLCDRTAGARNALLFEHEGNFSIG